MNCHRAEPDEMARNAFANDLRLSGASFSLIASRTELEVRLAWRAGRPQFPRNGRSGSCFDPSFRCPRAEVLMTL